MGIQKYRADKAIPQADGAIAHYAQWLGGPTLAKIGKCRIHGTDIRLTVCITGEPDTWFSVPAATQRRGKHVAGYVTSDESGYVFHAMDRHKARLA